MKVKDELKEYEDLLKLLEERNIMDPEMGAIVVQQLTWYFTESKKGKFFYNRVNELIIILTAIIPLINIFGDFKYTRVITTATSIAVGILIGISRLKSFKTTWKNYRQSAEEIKSELRGLLRTNEDGVIKIKLIEYQEEKVSAKEYFLERYEEIIGSEVGLWNQWLSKKHETTTGK